MRIIRFTNNVLEEIDAKCLNVFKFTNFIMITGIFIVKF